MYILYTDFIGDHKIFFFKLTVLYPLVHLWCGPTLMSIIKKNLAAMDFIHMHTSDAPKCFVFFYQKKTKLKFLFSQKAKQTIKFNTH